MEGTDVTGTLSLQLIAGRSGQSQSVGQQCLSEGPRAPRLMASPDGFASKYVGVLSEG